MKKHICCFMLLGICILAGAQQYPGYRVQGRHLYDNQGEKVVLVGVNKMICWTDIDGIPSYEEIARTGANCVRIVWGISNSADQLSTTIYNCRLQNMIPMVELHDATGEWNDLGICVDYWVRSDIVSVIQTHEEYLLINIANECGDANVQASAFRTEYTNAVQRMRNAGIHVPLIIDGTDWGKDINVLQSEGPSILSADPDQNVIFSVHMWWPEMWGYTEQTVIDEIAESINMGLPLIVGEFGALWEESTQGQIPYKAILRECTRNQIGWLAWSWGPGNDPQAFLDMTEDGTYNTLHDWGREVAVTDTNSIQNTAVRPASMTGTTPAPTATPVPTPEGNLAMNRPVTVSGVEKDGMEGENAVDGDLNTRWASQVGDPGWIYVDLGQETDITRVMIYWEAAYAKQYQIQVSNDANNWQDIYTDYNGDGGTDDVTVTGSGRYVRVYGTQRVESNWPHSMWELAIYGGSTSPTPDPTNPPGDNKGDVNGDGTVDIVDALLIAQCYVGLTACPDLDTGDTNCDGSITIVDALLTAQYYVGLISGFCL
jgi:mannan endo-1,4-beta-mannosidase